MTIRHRPRSRLALVLSALAFLAFAPALPAAAEQLAGLAAQGGDGCYFGECPEPGTPAPNLPEATPTEWEEPQQSPWPNDQLTSICQTPTFWCQMYEYGPVGADCWCADWNGYVYYGSTVPEL